jgi:hypothetical protein
LSSEDELIGEAISKIPDQLVQVLIAYSLKALDNEKDISLL